MNKVQAAAWVAFREAVEALGGVVLEESWKGTRTPHRVRCGAGHETTTTRALLKAGRRLCSMCSGLNPVAAEAAFKSRVEALGGVVLEESWNGTQSPHRVRCSNGHECSPRPNSVQQGQGICRKCSPHRTAPHWNVFYVVASDTVVKFGVASGDPQARLQDHKREGLTLNLFVRDDLPGSLAFDLEQLLISRLAAGGWAPVRGHEYFERRTCQARILAIVETVLGS